MWFSRLPYDDVKNITAVNRVNLRDLNYIVLLLLISFYYFLYLVINSALRSTFLSDLVSVGV